MQAHIIYELVCIKLWLQKIALIREISYLFSINRYKLGKDCIVP